VDGSPVPWIPFHLGGFLLEARGLCRLLGPQYQAGGRRAREQAAVDVHDLRASGCDLAAGMDHLGLARGATAVPRNRTKVGDVEIDSRIGDAGRERAVDGAAERRVEECRENSSVQLPIGL
jgi:hypothetical protein